MNKLKLKIIGISLVVFLIFGLLLVSCLGQLKNPVINTVVYATDTFPVGVTDISQTLANTPVPISTRTLQYATTPGSTQHPPLLKTPENTSSPTDFPPPTWTPLPTMDFLARNTEIVRLMSTNNDCRLPCWWGIMPGVTSWQEAQQFFETFGVIEEAVSRLSTQPDSDAYVAFFFESWN